MKLDVWKSVVSNPTKTSIVSSSRSISARHSIPALMFGSSQNVM
jgi:hypothetical protein